MLKPLFNKVVLEVEPLENKTKSGLILPESDEKSTIAKIVAIGEGKEVDGVIKPVTVEVGQRVLYSRYSGTEVKLDGKEYVVVSEDDILAIIQ